MNRHYGQWKAWLVKHGFSELASRKTFDKHRRQIQFTSQVSHTVRFIKERYFMLFSDSEIQQLSSKIKHEIFTARGSCYDPQNISEKLGVTIEQAVKIAEERKNKTKGTLENFIKRHGEIEGLKKFEDFKKKSLHSLETFVAKYGAEIGELKWLEYKKSKGRNEQDYIEKYGAVTGRKKWQELCQQKSISSSKAGIISKYGREYYDEMIARRNFKLSRQGMIAKYGEIAGVAKWEALCATRDSKSFFSVLAKCNGNLEDAARVYKEQNMKQSPIYVELRKLYEPEIAEQIYLKHIKTITAELNLPIHKSQAHLHRRTKGCVSKSANKFFAELERLVGRKLSYGAKRNELKLFNAERLETYYYDCYDNTTRVVIEFNGVGFHPKEGQTDFVNIGTGQGYEVCYQKDLRKQKWCGKMGYKLYIVWSDDITRKHKRQQLLHYLSQEIKNYENTQDNT